MRYEISEDQVTFFTENPKSSTPNTFRTPLCNSDFPLASIGIFADALCRQVFGMAVKSQLSYLSRFFKPFVHFIGQYDITLPQTSMQWQVLLLKFMRFYLLDQTYSKASTKYRLRDWSCATRAFQFWIDEDIMPLSVVVPSVDPLAEKVIANEQQLLGEGPKAIIHPDKPWNKLLVDISFSETESDYLAKIEQECLDKIYVLKKILLDHFKAMKNDHKTGNEVASTITREEIKERIRNRNFKKPGGGKSRATIVTSRTHPDGYIWALAKVKSRLEEGGSTDCISLKELRKSSFFLKSLLVYSDYTESFKEITALPEDVFDRLSPTACFYRFCGMLSSMDVAAACGLLTIEHPSLNSESIQNAKLLTARGNSFLLVGGDDNHKLFSVDKPRAKKRITVVLSPLSKEIIQHVIEITQPLRIILRKQGHKTWRYLFLGLQRSGHIGPFQMGMTRHFIWEKRSSLAHLYPELSDSGIEKGKCSYRRIRNTMGVLHWFKTGSIAEMSRIMGNSTRTVLEHYIPPALLQAWNTRIIRRFQNTLIILSAHNEDYLLEVTDFHNMDDLLRFIAQLVFEFPDNSSIIASDIHQKFGDRFRVDTDAHSTLDKSTGETILNLRLSENKLGFLYAFADYASRHPDKDLRRFVSAGGQHTVQQFIDLASMIRHACENEECGTALRELLDIERLRRYHKAALAQQEVLLSQFSRFSLTNAWGDSCQR